MHKKIKIIFLINTIKYTLRRVSTFILLLLLLLLYFLSRIVNLKIVIKAFKVLLNVIPGSL